MRRLLLALICFNGLACFLEAADSRPNIVFVITDDQRWDQLGYTGHPVLKRLTSTALPAKALPSIISLWLPLCVHLVGQVF
jgi:hypothetical protein